MPNRNDSGRGNRSGPPVERPIRPVTNVTATIKERQGERVGLIDRHDPNKGLLILRGIEAGEGITVEAVSNDLPVYATNNKVIRISATSTFPHDGEAGEVLTIGPDGERVWALPPGAGGGEANTASNLAGDTGIYATKVGTDLRFRGLSGGNGVDATQDATTITLSVVEGDLDLANMGGNLPVALGGTGRNTFAENTVLLGNGTDGIGVTLAASQGYLYFNGTDFVWSTPAVGEANTGGNLGGDAYVYASKNGVQLRFRGISAGDGIDVFEDVNDIVISVVPSEVTLDEFNGILGVPKGGTGRSSVTANALLVGNGTNAFNQTPAASAGYLRYTGTNFVWDTPVGEANSGISLGGAAIYVGKDGETLQFRGLLAGDGITITANPNNLSLSVDESGIDITATTGVLPLNRGGTGATTQAGARTALGLGTMAVQNADAVNISGGTASLASITVSGTTGLNGVTYTWPNADGTNGQVLSTNGTGALEWIDMTAGGGEANTGSSLGGTAAVFAGKTGVDLQFRGITAGTAATVIENADDITVGVDVGAIDITATSGNLSVSRGGTGQISLTDNAILVGNGTDPIDFLLAPNTDDVFLRYNLGAYEWVAIPDAGETNTASSLGGTADVFAQKNGVNLEFRGITPGNAITLTQNLTDIVVAVDEAAIEIGNTTGTLGVDRGGTGATTFTANGVLVGNGTDALSAIAAPTIAETFLAWNGTGFEWSAVSTSIGSLDDIGDVVFGSTGPLNGDVLTFDGTSWTAQAPADIDAGETNTASSLGGEAAIFAAKNGVDLEFRGLTGGNGIDLTENANDVVITVNQGEIDLANTAGTLGVGRGGTGQTALTANAILLGNGTNPISEIAAPGVDDVYLHWLGGQFVWSAIAAEGVASIDDIGDVDLGSTGATSGDVLTFDGTSWTAQAPAGSDGGEANTASSLGGEAAIFAQKIGIDLQFRGLTGGNGIDLAENLNDVVVTVNEGEININNTTGNLNVSRGGTGLTSLTANSLLFGNGINAVGEVAAPIAADTFLSWNGTGFEWSAVAGGADSLEELTDVTFGTAPTNGDILTFDGTTWTAQAAPEGGEVNTASSRGGDAAVFAVKTGVDLEFRGISGGNAITVTQQTNDILVAVNESGIDVTNTTGTLGVGRGGTGSTTFAANGLLVGDGGNPVTSIAAPAVADTYLHWTGTAFEWIAVTDTGEVNTASNLGGTTAVFAQKNGVDFEFRGLTAGSAIALTQNINDIVVAVDETAINVSNTTGTLPLTRGGTGAGDAITARTNLGLGTIATQDANSVAITGGDLSGVTVAATTLSATGTTTFNGIAYTWPGADGTAGQILSTGGDGTLTWIDAAAGGGEANDGASLGGDVAVFANKTGTTLNFRGITSGDGVDVADNGNDIILSVNEGEVDLANLGGILTTAQGGTGATTFTANGVLVGNGTGALSVTAAPTTADTYLRWTGAAFAWTAVASGEVDDGTNLGTGSQVFAQKNASNLEFRTLIEGTAIDLVQGTNEITISVVEGDINVANTTGILPLSRGGTGGNDAPSARTSLGLGTMATQNADNVAITGGTATFANITVGLNTTLNTVTYAWPGADGTSGQVLSTGGDGTLTWVDPPVGGGEANTASSLGGEASLVGTKNGNDLPFRGLTGGNAITVTERANDVLVDVVEGDIDLANTTGTLGVDRGGTGATTLTANGVLVGNGTGAVNAVAAPTTADTFLSWNGTAFEWAAVAGGGGATSLDDLTDVDLTTEAPTGGDVLSYDGTNWVAEADAPVTVADDGTTIGTQRQINFTGAGVTVTDDAANGRVNVDIPGGGGGGSPFAGRLTINVTFNGLGQVSAASSPDAAVTNVAITSNSFTVTHTLGTMPMYFIPIGIDTSGNYNQVFPPRTETYLTWTGTGSFSITALSAATVRAGNGGTAIFYIFY